MPTIKALEGMGRPYALVINQAPTNRQARLTSAVSMRLSSQGTVIPVPIAARIDHQYAYALGQGVTEFAPDGKAAAEVSELWAWCRKSLEGNNGQQTKRRA
jgi:chromosome partitioning protein